MFNYKMCAAMTANILLLEDNYRQEHDRRHLYSTPIAFNSFCRDIDDVKPDKGKTAIRLKSFLCCFELDSAGLFVGWTCLMLGLLTSALCAMALSIMNLGCKDYGTILEALYPVLEFKYDSCPSRKSLFITTTFLGTVFGVIFAIVAGSCIYGTLKRNARKVKPMVDMLPLASFLGFLNILAFTWTRAVIGVTSGCIFAYLFLCLRSFYFELKEEAKKIEPTASV